MKKIATLFVVIALFSGCSNKEEIVKMQNEKAQYAAMLEMSVQKDSLNDVMADATATINEVYDKLLYLTGENGKPVHRQGSEAETAVWFSTLDSVSNVINSSKTRIQDLESKIMSIERQNPQLAAHTNAIKVKLASMKDKFASQETDVRKLYADFYELKAQDSTLVGTMATKASVKNTDKSIEVKKVDNEPKSKFVYYSIGTEDELLKRGIVQQVGGADLWVLGKHGETLTPAKELNVKKFNSFDVFSQSEIIFIKKCKRFAVVSSHNPKFLTPNYDDNKKIVSLKITDSEKFWLPSQFLIIAVEE
ncbi:MAG: hypothetical protein IPM69_18040 [Ignavibacteria bacterium]|nr:hypothetical protein [Ignavibacteria bacterium]